MFDNDLSDHGPTRRSSVRSQLLAHVPIAIIAAGLLATMVALHVAVASVVIIAVAHVAVGLVLLLVRRHRTPST